MRQNFEYAVQWLDLAINEACNPDETPDRAREDFFRAVSRAYGRLLRADLEMLRPARVTPEAPAPEPLAPLKPPRRRGRKASSSRRRKPGRPRKPPAQAEA